MEPEQFLERDDLAWIEFLGHGFSYGALQMTFPALLRVPTVSVPR